MSWSTAAPTCFTHVGLRNMTVTPILWLLNCLCVICVIHLLTYNRTCRGNATGVPRQNAFSSKASGWYYDSLVYFLNMPLCYQHSAFFLYRLGRNIKITLDNKLATKICNKLKSFTRLNTITGFTSLVSIVMLRVEVQLHQHILLMWRLGDNGHNRILTICLCVICAIHLLTPNRTCWGNATEVPRQKKSSSKASGWYYYSLVYFLNMPSYYQHSTLFLCRLGTKH